MSLDSSFQRESFFYHQGELSLNSYAKAEEASSISRLVALSSLLEDLDRPTYVYSLETIKKRIDAYKKAFSFKETHLHYAVKANPNPELLAFLKSEGLGADVVSIGEFRRALESGFKAEDVIFSGVSKMTSEIREAIRAGIFQINCESLAELKRIIKVAEEEAREVSIGVRLNPDIPVETHPYIATGFRENKFGVPLSQLKEISKLVEQSEYLRLRSLSCHIGSQIMDHEPLVRAAQSLEKARVDFNLDQVELLDLGGGLGVDYHSDDESKDLQRISEFGARLEEVFKNFPGHLLLEPGRSLVARSGVLLTRVEYLKNNGYKDFVLVNTGMHHLMRPSLYSAYHKIIPLQESQARSSEYRNYDVVGPICESSDVLGHDRRLPPLKEGDFLAVLDAGAYGASMASAYNLHAFPLERFL